MPNNFDLQASDFINAKERFSIKPRSEPPIDKEVSLIVGQAVRTTDPRLLKLVVKWKQENNKPDTDLSRDDYLYDAKKINELKDAFR